MAAKRQGTPPLVSKGFGNRDGGDRDMAGKHGTQDPE